LIAPCWSASRDITSKIVVGMPVKFGLVDFIRTSQMRGGTLGEGSLTAQRCIGLRQVVVGKVALAARGRILVSFEADEAPVL
jgi:hypothetical protein